MSETGSSLISDSPARALPPRNEMERAMLAGDASYDGVFVVAVRTTGIFCLPSCRPPRRPLPENVEFFGTIREALVAGYRACKLCRPLELEGGHPAWVERLFARVEQAPHERIQSSDLRGWGLSPERVRRWFQKRYGMTFAAWCRGRRLSEAFTRIREGAELDDVALEHGYASHSGFREAFGQTFGQPPGRSEQTQCVVTAMLDSPLGRLLAAATDEGVCLLEYTDRRMLERNLATMRRRFNASVVPGEHRWLQKLQTELRAYFDGQLTEFTVPVAPHGTPFQERVWQELRRIPHGATISYEELAVRIGQPTAVRAVANANGQNRVNILIPCHRVIGKNGELTGYGGGLWRKRLLLELEHQAHC
ncbi:MAG: methylated-DNA--[protein]-cysteine S-methyltransferase [Planctomycetaceae bacterium]|nr:methylated-DNA--[protein]-cysteine S-methyltransferase [Planctomycetaceae bacterium]